MHCYKLIRSSRRTVSVEIAQHGNVVVRAPLHMPSDEIEKFVGMHDEWIDKNIEKVVSREKFEEEHKLTDEQIEKLKAAARIELPALTENFSHIVGHSPASVKITSAKTRFGSCGIEGNICYSYRLMLYPPSAREYVVMHELCHLVHHNHGKRFYKLLEKYMPDYRERQNLLKSDPA